jgi:hypothetical protein
VADLRPSVHAVNLPVEGLNKIEVFEVQPDADLETDVDVTV